MIDDSSSDEKMNVDKGDSKGKKPMESERESVLTETKLSDIKRYTVKCCRNSKKVR